MNLRELVAELECQGKPQFSESPVVIMDDEGRVFTIKELRFTDTADFEGMPESWRHGTVFIKVEET